MYCVKYGLISEKIWSEWIEYYVGSKFYFIYLSIVLVNKSYFRTLIENLQSFVLLSLTTSIVEPGFQIKTNCFPRSHDQGTRISLSMGARDINKSITL